MSTLNARLTLRPNILKTIDQLKQNVESVEPTSYGAMSNTGQAANSFRYRWLSDTHLQIYSDIPGTFNYIMTLEHGRKPGKRPPRSAIMEWINQRGIEPTGITKESLAFLIARKIGQEGSLVYRQGGKTGIISQVQTPEWIEENFIEPIRESIKRTIGQSLSAAAQN